MTPEEVEKMPCMENLDRFVQKLPPEFHSEVYSQVETFLRIGAGNGAMTAALSFAGVKESEREGDHQAFIAYLKKRPLKAWKKYRDFG